MAEFSHLNRYSLVRLVGDMLYKLNPDDIESTDIGDFAEICTLSEPILAQPLKSHFLKGGILSIEERHNKQKDEEPHIFLCASVIERIKNIDEEQILSLFNFALKEADLSEYNEAISIVGLIDSSLDEVKMQLANDALDKFSITDKNWQVCARIIKQVGITKHINFEEINLAQLAVFVDVCADKLEQKDFSDIIGNLIDFTK